MTALLTSTHKGKSRIEQAGWLQREALLEMVLLIIMRGKLQNNKKINSFKSRKSSYPLFPLSAPKIPPPWGSPPQVNAKQVSL